MKKLYGVTAAMVTPFTENGKVDTRNLAILTDKLEKRNTLSVSMWNNRRNGAFDGG